MKDFGTYYRGDTFPGVKITIREDGVPIDMTGAVVRAQFRQDQPKGEITHEVNTNDNSITLGTTAEEPSFTVQPFDLDMPTGKHVVDFHVELGSTTRTYVPAFITILQDITQ